MPVKPMTPPADRPIRCVLDGVIHELRDVPPTRTVLQWLREDLGRTGTKEGCAEGDCGACTVVIAEPVEADDVYGDPAADPAVVSDGTSATRAPGLRYRAVNACIQFVPTLDGKALYTVESLKRPGGSAHPVQQAMVETHGSQCGFCTPGFVMSLFALYKSDPAPDRQMIDDSLAGNLCRCTGYRPIVDAACRMYEIGHALAPDAMDALNAPAGAGGDRARRDEQSIATTLRSLASPEGAVFPHTSGRFFAPRTVDELAAVLEERPEARIVAGATDVGLWVTKQHRAIGDVIYLGEVRALRAITATPTHLEIGAGDTLTEVMPALAGRWPDLAELLRRYASPPIRNAATLGGNVVNGSPIGDSMPLLIALRASLVLASARARREVPIEDFYTGYRRSLLAPDELLVAIRIPRAAPDLALRAWKVSKRFEDDISAVCVAVALRRQGGRITQARIGVGGMAAVPSRAQRTEAALEGQPWSLATLQAAANQLRDEFTPLSDMRASAAYRRTVAGNLLLRLWHETEDTSPALQALVPSP